MARPKKVIPASPRMMISDNIRIASIESSLLRTKDKIEIRSTCLREAASAKAGEIRNKHKCSKYKCPKHAALVLNFEF
jgi:hypothetical protein